MTKTEHPWSGNENRRFIIDTMLLLFVHWRFTTDNFGMFFRCGVSIHFPIYFIWRVRRKSNNWSVFTGRTPLCIQYMRNVRKTQFYWGFHRQWWRIKGALVPWWSKGKYELRYPLNFIGQTRILLFTVSKRLLKARLVLRFGRLFTQLCI